MQTSAGRKLSDLSRQLDAETPVLQLTTDPDALAPERLLVFELTGSVLNFEKAVSRIPGLEFLNSEDLDPDEDDDNPVVYMMVPTEGALRNIVTLWRDWKTTGAVPYGYSPWKNLLSQLRDIRPWGPQDRITPEDYEILRSEVDSGNAIIRIEIELVFRRDGTAAQIAARAAIAEAGGTVISHCRIEGAGYEALLSDIPNQALRTAIERTQEGLTGEISILQIRPQSLFDLDPIEHVDGQFDHLAPTLAGEPIAAIFDAVPMQGHQLIAAALEVDDLFGLEDNAVGARVHGTAMASAVVHGDLNQSWPRALERPIYFLNMMYAPEGAGASEKFPDQLPADMFEQALIRMRDGEDATAPHVIIINASLGDANKPFANRMSGWARCVDYLSEKYGVLFIVSAGNCADYLETQDVTATEFEGFTPDEKMRSALRASARQMRFRRVLAPAESLNAITVGALHADNFVYPHGFPAYTFDVWDTSGLCNVSSRLGPGYQNATKPDILAPGGKHVVRLSPAGNHHRLVPHSNASSFGGIGVAAPPTDTNLGVNLEARSVGTSVATALVTGVAARAHEALEAAYPDFIDIPARQRALLIKALLVHSARWTHARDLLVDVLGPRDSSQHGRQKDNVRRFLGFGAYDPEKIINCTDDAATLWVVGMINSDEGMEYHVPWPVSMTGKAIPHTLTATLAWFTPPRVGAVAYRGVRMKIVESKTELGVAGVKAPREQPDSNQAHKGTVVHRRWEGEKAAAIAGDGFFNISIQREADGLPESAAFALVFSMEMPGEESIYTEVLNRVAIKPAVPVQV